MVSVFFSIYFGIKGSNHLLKGRDCLLNNRAFLYQLLAINRVSGPTSYNLETCHNDLPLRHYSSQNRNQVSSSTGMGLQKWQLHVVARILILSTPKCTYIS